jgi:hypothetical protein
MKSKAGRPKLDDITGRKSILLVRLTRGEKELLTRKAKEADKKLSKWVRERLLA